MKHNFRENSVHTFKQNKLTLFITNYVDRFFLIAVIFLTVFVVLKFGLNLIAVFTFSIPILIIYIYGKLIRQFAYKITIDFLAKEITYFMYKSEDVFVRSFNEIHSIYVNGYIIMKSNNNTIYYNDLKDEEIFYLLNRIKKIQFGPLSVLSGPSAKVKNFLNKA